MQIHPTFGDEGTLPESNPLADIQAADAYFTGADTSASDSYAVYPTITATAVNGVPKPTRLDGRVKYHDARQLTKVSRKQTRRVAKKLTSLEVRMVAMGQQRPGSPNKRALKTARRAEKLQRAARFISGLLIRATGAAAPALVKAAPRLDAYHQGLADRGAEAIYFPSKAV
jgi:hypothetical protein